MVAAMELVSVLDEWLVLTLWSSIFSLWNMDALSSPWSRYFRYLSRLHPSTTLNLSQLESEAYLPRNGYTPFHYQMLQQIWVWAGFVLTLNSIVRTCKTILTAVVDSHSYLRTLEQYIILTKSPNSIVDGKSYLPKQGIYMLVFQLKSSKMFDI